MNITAYQLAERYIGILEIAGDKHHPLIQWWHSLCGLPGAADEVPWCSSFINGIAWELRLPRSKSAAARSWLNVGRPISIKDAMAEWDVCIFKRGTDHGPEVINAPGHVAFYAGLERNTVLCLGGNQGNSVSVSAQALDKLIGVRRLYVE